MDAMTFFDTTGTVKYVRGKGAGDNANPIAFAKIELPQPALLDTYVNEYLKHSGSVDLNVDGSSVNVEFSNATTVAVGKQLILSRINFYLETSTTMTSSQFGDGVALTNGLEIKINDDSFFVFKKNLDLIINANTIVTGFTNILHAQIDFPFGYQITEGKNVKAIVKDDLTGLSKFVITIQGQIFEL